MQLTSTPRGARLARRLMSHWLHEWGHPYEGEGNQTVTLVAAELVENAVTHGYVPERDFNLRLTATPTRHASRSPTPARSDNRRRGHALTRRTVSPAAGCCSSRRWPPTGA